MALVKGARKNGRPAEFTEEILDNLADKLIEWCNNDGGVYLGSFAKDNGFHRCMFTEFCERSKKFADAYVYAKQWQENKFLQKGLTREWDPGFTQYVLGRVGDRIWLKSYDKPEDSNEQKQPVIIVNKIYKDKEDAITESN